MGKMPGTLTSETFPVFTKVLSGIHLMPFIVSSLVAPQLIEKPADSRETMYDVCHYWHFEY